MDVERMIQDLETMYLGIGAALTALRSIRQQMPKREPPPPEPSAPATEKAIREATRKENRGK